MTDARAIATAFGRLEVDIRDSERLAKVLRELFLARSAGVELQLTKDEHEYMMEVLFDRLQELTGKITKDFYKAFKSAGRDQGD